MAKILIVDDSALSRAIIGDLLRNAGHKVIEAEDGSQGVGKYLLEGPDAVLMDVTMPGMDGLATLAALRKIDPAARVAMLTAKSQTQIALAAIQKGACDFVVKPFDDERLLLAVQRLLESRQQREKPPRLEPL